MTAGDIRYAYLHGFGSSSRSHKGTRLREILAPHGIELELLDLNVPSFSRLTYTASLAHLDALDEGFSGRWRFIGSSMGGYLAARWSELRPDRVDRLLLLCPGFDLTKRWMKLLGADAMARWRAYGVFPFPDADGRTTDVWWHFIEDALTHPAVPRFTQETHIIHGSRDATVPIAGSERVAAERSNITLITVDDDHGLAASIDGIASEVLHFLAPDTQRS